MILKYLQKASYSGNRAQDSSSETDYFVSDEFVFWEKIDPRDEESVRFTFAERLHIY